MFVIPIAGVLKKPFWGVCRNTVVFLSFTLLWACQTTPYQRHEDPNTFIRETMQALKKQADTGFTLPGGEEYRLIHKAMRELMLQEDDRYFSIINLLKEQKISLMANEAKRFSMSSEAQESPGFAQQLKYYSLAVLSFLDPLEAQAQFNRDINHVANPELWKSLAKLLNQRLGEKKNKIVQLRRQLLVAETQRNISKQLKLHRELLNLNEQLQQFPEMIFHLDRILALTPDFTSSKRATLEHLTKTHLAQGNHALAQNIAMNALKMARALNETEVVARLEKELNLTFIDPSLKNYALEQKTRIKVLQNALNHAEDYTSDHWLALSRHHWNLGQIKQSKSAVVKGLSLAREENNRTKTANNEKEALAIQYLGDFARVSGDLQRALTQYTLALKLYKAQNKTDEVLSLQSKVAMMAFFLSRTKEALHFLNKILDNAKNDLHWQYGKALAEIAIVESMAEKQFNPLNEKWQEGLAIIRRFNNLRAEEEILGEAAIVLQAFDQKELAIQYYQRAAQLALQQSRYFHQAKYLTNLALTHQYSGNQEIAESTLKQSAIILKVLESDLLSKIEKLLLTASKNEKKP